ncbi:hypothetical protein Ancab_023144 [Ancistrocladus abbreviatus]
MYCSTVVLDMGILNQGVIPYLFCPCIILFSFQVDWRYCVMDICSSSPMVLKVGFVFIWVVKFAVVIVFYSMMYGVLDLSLFLREVLPNFFGHVLLSWVPLVAKINKG